MKFLYNAKVMSSDSGEGYPVSRDHSNDTDEFVRSQAEVQIILEALGPNPDPRLKARYANGSRKLYFKSGNQENMQDALHFYESALSGLEKDDALKSWVLCSRLNLYLHEYRHGNFDREQLLAEVEIAMETAQRVPFPERKRGQADLWWLAATRASIRNDEVKEIASRGRETYSVRHLELVGGTAVASVTPGLEAIPKPELEAI